MRRYKTLKMASIITIFAMAIGYFLAVFFVWLSNEVEFLGFLRYVGFSRSFGFENISINLMFLRLNFGLTFSISIIGVVLTAISLIVYFRRK